jgi:hypothetical protein
VSDTPRTDAAWEAALSLPGGGYSANPNTLGLAVEMSRFAKDLERELAAERALADRLAESIEWYRLNAGDCNKGGDDGALARDALSKDIGRNATKALAAWKEARNDT